jgi:sulfate adenylyltransferase subunit 2
MRARYNAGPIAASPASRRTPEPMTSPTTSRNSNVELDRLEAESLHILREVAAECRNPVMLYSIGKDSSVLLHLLLKAFAPAVPPIPLLHVDTTWKFREMIDFRDRRAAETGVELRVHINPDGVRDGIGPITHGATVHTEVMKTQALKQALAAGGYDAAIGGARRDEEKSRAKERVFSFRDAQQRWDPRRQRPELWNLYNARVNNGDSVRVFPLSNWTELDVWRYIRREGIPLVSLYFAAERPVVERDGALIMVDDDRLPLRDGETPQQRRIRFRTLGCYPLTGAVESDAADLDSVIAEMETSALSERAGRLIDQAEGDSMEKKKREGYF